MEWKEVRLGDVCSIQRGASPRPIQKFISKEGMPWVKIADATGISSRYISSTSEYIIKEGVSKSRIVYPGDLIVSNSATPGLPKFMAIEACVHDGWLIIRDFDGIDKVFLYYVFLNIRRRLSNQANGSVFMNLKTDIVKDFVIKLPTLDAQRRIASILSSLDRKIELNNKINADLEEMAQAIFKNWFVDFEPFKDGEFVDSELGMIPEGWKVGCLGDIAEITSGKRPPKKSKDKTKELFIPLIGASDIMGFTSDVLYERPILVIGRVGTHGVVQRFQEKCWPSDNTLVVESSYYNYVYQLLKGIDYSAINRGSTQPLITQTDVKNTDVIIAPENVLKEYESITSTLFSKHRANIKESSRLSLLRDTLLPRLMSGELEVPE